MADHRKRDRDERHRLAPDPEATVQALIAVNPEQGPELNDEDLRRIVDGAATDPEPDEPPSADS